MNVRIPRKFLIKIVNIKPIAPFKPKLRNLARKFNLLSTSLYYPEVSSDVGDFQRILLLENFTYQEFEPKNIITKEVITPDLERKIRSVAKKGATVIAFAHDNFTENLGGIQTVMNLENNVISGTSGNYWSLNPVESVNSYTFSPLLDLLHNGEKVGQIESRNIGQFFKILEDIAGKQNKSMLIVLHSLLGHDPEKVADALKGLEIGEIYFYLHDFYSICPSVKLLRNDLEFCHGPKMTSTACKVCIYGNARPVHVRRIDSILNLPGIKLLAPSESTHDIWSASSELGMKADLMPHLRLTPTASGREKINSKPKIAFIGHPVKGKGWESFVILSKLLDETNEFWVFSQHDPRVSGITFRLLTNGSGKIHHTRDLLIESEIDYAFIFPNWPETYSLVTAEAISAAVFVLTNSNSGNVAALVREFNSGAVFEDLESVVEFLKFNPKVNFDLQIYDTEFAGIVEKFARTNNYG